ncbi:hypothetical protein QTV49_000367 [Vibrio vulnificus]|nr:hypothetical protein [Vibrio vulnificus]
MKKFVLHKWFGVNLTNEILTNFIQDNTYALEEFDVTEDYRCGFSQIHKKLNNVFVEGDGFVKTTFKMATRTINKKRLGDLVRQKIQENAQKGLDVKVADVEFAMKSKLKASADFKFAEFEIMFDTKNNIIYSSTSYNIVEDKLLPFLKMTFPELKVRTFKTKQDAHRLAEFFTYPDIMPDGYRPVSSVKVEKSDGTMVTFDDADLSQQSEFKAIVETGDFLVHQVAMLLFYENQTCFFKINNKFLPTNISVSGTETEAEMTASAELSGASSEGSTKELSKEEVLFDSIYTNTIILNEAFGKIASFLFDFNEMETQEDKLKSK